jgi:hypothetical protein
VLGAPAIDPAAAKRFHVVVDAGVVGGITSMFAVAAT